MATFDYMKYVLDLGYSPDKCIQYRFEDGTGFVGKPCEFQQYAERRFAAFPDDSFEIDDWGVDPDGPSYEIFPVPENAPAGTPLIIGLKDPRF
jgi:hypothetical protein